MGEGRCTRGRGGEGARGRRRGEGARGAGIVGVIALAPAKLICIYWGGGGDNLVVSIVLYVVSVVLLVYLLGRGRESCCIFCIVCFIFCIAGVSIGEGGAILLPTYSPAQQ